MKIRAILTLLLLLCIDSAQAWNPADIYLDNKVDWLDVKLMADNWLFDGNTPADIDNSGDVDGMDFAILANNWGWVETPIEIVFVYINDSGAGMKDVFGNPANHGGFTGEMSKYETTVAQYCDYLNAAMTSGDIIMQSGKVYGNSGTYDGQMYYNMISPFVHISYSGGTFFVESPDGYNRANHPVVEVSWYGAMAFASYYGWRLPTEWEWQAVADYDGTYSHGCGTSLDPSKANYGFANPLGLSTYALTNPVDYFTSYGYGMNDMTGNVMEWTTSCYHDGCSSDYIALRGGSYGSVAHVCDVWDRLYAFPHNSGSKYGFRVCR